VECASAADVKVEALTWKPVGVSSFVWKRTGYRARLPTYRWGETLNTTLRIYLHYLRSFSFFLSFLTQRADMAHGHREFCANNMVTIMGCIYQSSMLQFAVGFIITPRHKKISAYAHYARTSVLQLKQRTDDLCVVYVQHWRGASRCSNYFYSLFHLVMLCEIFTHLVPSLLLLVCSLIFFLLVCSLIFLLLELYPSNVTYIGMSSVLISRCAESYALQWR